MVPYMEFTVAKATTNSKAIFTIHLLFFSC
jgi:hypothetical protein